MLLEFALSAAAVVISYALYRRYNVRNIVPYPVIGAIYSFNRPFFSIMFLLCFSISTLVGEAVFRRFLVYGMRVFHIQLLTSLLLMLPYSLAKSDEISLALSMLSGQMAYDTHSSRDQIKTAISFVLTFIAVSLTYWLIKGYS